MRSVGVKQGLFRAYWGTMNCIGLFDQKYDTHKILMKLHYASLNRTATLLTSRSINTVMIKMPHRISHMCIPHNDCQHLLLVPWFECREITATISPLMPGTSTLAMMEWWDINNQWLNQASSPYICIYTDVMESMYS